MTLSKKKKILIVFRARTDLAKSEDKEESDLILVYIHTYIATHTTLRRRPP